MHRRWWLLIPVVLLGCSTRPKDEMISGDKVPPAALKAAEQLYPGFKPTQVWKIDQDGETAYEFRGKAADGKSHETTISETGKVLWPVPK